MAYSGLFERVDHGGEVRHLDLLIGLWDFDNDERLIVEAIIDDTDDDVGGTGLA